MMRRLVANLQNFEPEIDGEQIADLLWLAQHITIAAPTASPAPAPKPVVVRTERLTPDRTELGAAPALPDVAPPPSASVYTSESVPASESVPSGTRLPFRAAATRALRQPMELERALRPLMRKVPSRSRYQLDEVATAERIAETSLPTPVKLAERERWLDVALVVEETSLTEIWRKSIDEFQRLLEHLGAFRDVRVWTMRRRQNENAPQPPFLNAPKGYILGELEIPIPPRIGGLGGRSGNPTAKTLEIGTLELFPRHQRQGTAGRVHSHQELIDPTQRRLILVLSDCTSDSWWEGKVHPWLQDWAAVNMVSVVQLLPPRMWERGILGEALPVQLRAQMPGTLNHQWQLEGLPVWRSAVPDSELTLPVVALEPEALGQWARAIAGFGEFPTAGVVFEAGWQQGLDIPALPSVPAPAGLSPAEVAQQAQQWVEQFRKDASPMARRLAVLMAAAPVNLDVVGLIQETLLKKSANQVHVAEVYLGGLMQRVGDRDTTRFEFKPGVRAELRKSLPRAEARQVLDAVSGYIADRLGLPLRSLDALLMADLPEELEGDVLPFAEIAIETLRQMGGNYATFAEQVVQSRGTGSPEPEPTHQEESQEQDNYQSDEDVSAYAHAALNAQLDYFTSKILDTFIQQEHDFRLSGHPREMRDIDEVILAEADISVEVLDSNLTEISQTYRSFELSVKINFSVEIRYADYEAYHPTLEEAVPTFGEVVPHQAVQALAVINLWFSETNEVEPELVELRVEEPISVDLSQHPEVAVSASSFQAFEFEVETVEVEGAPNAPPEIALEPFEFDMATLEQRKTGTFRRKTEWVIQRQLKQARQFIERLPESVALEMVAIPAGEFLMGSPPEEPKRQNDEGPQHRVTVPEFYLGKYPITQAQWRVVAGLPPVEQALKPDPSRFKGDDRPVESVSWDDATEFCVRLSQLTGRDYRLPSEAEWEYACRAGTTTPFHFGETITPDLANYDWDVTYGEIKVTKQKEFEETTPVGQFGVANTFGLYDMHGNVWEWCADHWHSNYEAAPTDGSAWLSDKKDANRLLRGGSWLYDPEVCRSAFRYDGSRDHRNYVIGFRVSCAAARALQ